MEEVRIQYLLIMIITIITIIIKPDLYSEKNNYNGSGQPVDVPTSATRTEELEYRIIIIIITVEGVCNKWEEGRFYCYGLGLISISTVPSWLL